MANSKSENIWRADVDGLRAIAVLAVVVHHAVPAFLTGGFIGVDVFFVISGYLITGLLLREHTTGRFSLVRFYERRARRLFPALAVVLAFTVVAVFLVAHPPQILETARLGVAATFSVANVSLWRSAGYFDTASHLKPFLHLWSLGVEEQFYFVWPLLLAFLLRTRAIVPAVVAGILLCLLVTEAMNESHRNAVFYLPFFRAWELGLGSLIAIFELQNGTSERLLDETAAERLVTLGIVLILISAVWLTPATPFPGLSALPAVAGTALVIWAGGQRRSLPGVTTRLLTSRPFVFFGLISYSLYLWHWPLLAVPAAAGVELSLAGRLLLIGIAVGFSALTLKWIEKPARTSSTPRRAAILSCLALLAACGLAVTAYAIERRAAASPERRLLASSLSWPDHQSARSGCPASAAALAPALAYCRASRDSPPDALVWGDSHADHLYPGIVELDPQRNWMLLGHMSCPPVAGIEVAADQPDCRARSEAALKWIEEQRGISSVVVGLFGHYADSTDRAEAHRGGPIGPSRIRIEGELSHLQKARALERGLDAAIGRLLEAGKRVVLVIDVPELPFSPVNCFTKPRISLSGNQCFINLHDVLDRQRSIRSVISRIQSRHPDLVVVDPIPSLCVADRCGPGTIDAPLYRDSHHLSLHGSVIIASAILEAEGATTVATKANALPIVAH